MFLFQVSGVGITHHDIRGGLPAGLEEAQPPCECESLAAALLHADGAAAGGTGAGLALQITHT